MTTAAHIHGILYFLPLLFFSTAFLADFLAYFGRINSVKIGTWLVVIGVISCIPVLITGMTAMEHTHTPNIFLEKHRYLGMVCGLAGSLYAGLRIAYSFWSLPLQPVHFVFLSMLLVALIIWTMDYGYLAVQFDHLTSDVKSPITR